MDAREVKRRQERREQIRAELEKTSKQFADDAWKVWGTDEMPGALEKAFAEERERGEAIVSNLRAEVESIQNTRDMLTGLLQELQGKRGNAGKRSL